MSDRVLVSVQRVYSSKLLGPCARINQVWSACRVRYEDEKSPDLFGQGGVRFPACSRCHTGGARSAHYPRTPGRVFRQRQPARSLLASRRGSLSLRCPHRTARRRAALDPPSAGSRAGSSPGGPCPRSSLSAAASSLGLALFGQLSARRGRRASSSGKRKACAIRAKGVQAEVHGRARNGCTARAWCVHGRSHVGYRRQLRSLGTRPKDPERSSAHRQREYRHGGGTCDLRLFDRQAVEESACPKTHLCLGSASRRAS